MRKAGLPKREPSLECAGQSARRSVADCRMERMEVMVGWWGFEETAEMGRSITASVMLKMNEAIKVCVGEARKSSWSSVVRMRRVGCVKEKVSSDGGLGIGGVFGAGFLGARGVDFGRCRGTRRGICVERSGTGSVAEGMIVVFCAVVEEATDGR